MQTITNIKIFNFPRDNTDRKVEFFKVKLDRAQ